VKPFIAAQLVSRAYWREGDATARLRAVEKRARLRSKMHADYIDPALERRIAKAAKRARKALA
jgi:hypothetical protein